MLTAYDAECTTRLAGHLLTCARLNAQGIGSRVGMRLDGTVYWPKCSLGHALHRRDNSIARDDSDWPQ